MRNSRESIVKSLSSEFGFSVEEGMMHLEKEYKVKEKKVKEKKVIIPWCGEINELNCNGIRVNHGLYTQCVNNKVRDSLCKTCYNQSLKSENKEPAYGLIQERKMKGSNYRDRKGKKPAQYGNVMIELNISREEAEKYAASQGMRISEEDFEVKKGNRGRPKKSTLAKDTSDEEEEEIKPTKKGRGRPKKKKEEATKTLSHKEEEGNLTCSLVDEEIPPLEESEEEEEVEVKEFTFNKKLYYRNPINNALYDPKSYEHIGTWDEENEIIIDINEEDD